MGDLASDHDAAIELVIGEHRRLSSHDHNHPLLRYVCDVSDQGFRYSPDAAVRKEFFDAYAPEEGTPVAVLLAKYFVDLRDAVDKIEGIDRSPKPMQSSAVNPVKKLDEIGEESHF